jgi:hypothetical protein
MAATKTIPFILCGRFHDREQKELHLQLQRWHQQCVQRIRWSREEGAPSKFERIYRNCQKTSIESWSHYQTNLPAIVSSSSAALSIEDTEDAIPKPMLLLLLLVLLLLLLRGASTVCNSTEDSQNEEAVEEEELILLAAQRCSNNNMLAFRRSLS